MLDVGRAKRAKGLRDCRQRRRSGRRLVLGGVGRGRREVRRVRRRWRAGLAAFVVGAAGPLWRGEWGGKRGDRVQCRVGLENGEEKNATHPPSLLLNVPTWGKIRIIQLLLMAAGDGPTLCALFSSTERLRVEKMATVRCLVEPRFALRGRAKVAVC